MIYVMGDIHGEKDKFFNMLRQIDFSYNDELYIIGDVIDRGLGSIDILKYVLKQPNIHFLIGNHEHMMLDSENLYSFYTWMMNGGELTLNLLEEEGSDFIKELFSYLNKCNMVKTITLNNKKYILTHAGINDILIRKIEKNEPFTKKDVEFLLWNREWFRYGINNDYTIIFGHTPIPLITGDKMPPYLVWKNDNKIGIDCGAFYLLGQLACIRLNDEKIFYQE